MLIFIYITTQNNWFWKGKRYFYNPNETNYNLYVNQVVLESMNKIDEKCMRNQ